MKISIKGLLDEIEIKEINYCLFNGKETQIIYICNDEKKEICFEGWLSLEISIEKMREKFTNE